jgi:hypothetical protein
MSRNYLAEKKNSVSTAAARIVFLKNRVAKDMKEAQELSDKLKKDEATVREIEALEAQKEEIRKTASISRETIVHLDRQATEALMQRMQSVTKDLDEVDAKIRTVFYGK